MAGVYVDMLTEQSASDLLVGECSFKEHITADKIFDKLLMLWTTISTNTAKESSSVVS